MTNVSAEPGPEARSELDSASSEPLHPAAREALIGEIQDKVAADLSTIPYMQGAQVAVVGTDIDGVTLDASFKFRYAPITKG